MSTLTLTNQSTRLVLLFLRHEHFCKALGRCSCVELPTSPPRKGPAVLALAAGTTSAALPEAVLQVPEVQQALREGWLVIGRSHTGGAA